MVKRASKQGDLFTMLLKALMALLAALFGGAQPKRRAVTAPAAARRSTGGGGGVPTYEVSFAWPERGDFDFSVVGESFSQPALQSIRNEIEAASGELFDVALVPYENPHDHLAVAVVAPGARVLGHLSRADARSYRRRLASKKRSGQVGACKARLIGGHVLRDGELAQLGVLLDIKPFD